MTGVVSLKISRNYPQVVSIEDRDYFLMNGLEYIFLYSEMWLFSIAVLLQISGILASHPGMGLKPNYFKKQCFLPVLNAWNYPVEYSIATLDLYYYLR